jgi:chitinase
LKPADAANLAKLATYLDRYNMQSYQGGNTGMFTGGNFQSWFYGALGGISALHPYSIDYGLEQLAALGIPKAKLGMGIAFYSACYKIPGTTPSGGQDVSGPRMPTGAPMDWCWDCGVGGADNVSSYNYFYASDGLFAQSTAAERKRDDVAQEPYLSFSSPKYDKLCGGNTRYVIYEDEVSLKAKGAFSRKNGYGGVIIWTLQQGWLPQNAAGGRARNALMQALREGFLAP